MEREAFFTGYCRTLDQSRMVCAVREGEQLTEVDCAYPNCPHVAECTVARALEEFLK